LRSVTRAKNLEAARPYRPKKYQKRNNAECPGLVAALSASRSKKALAVALGISGEAVNNWKRVPVERVLEVEKITGVPREELRPDIYPPADDQSASREHAAA
jgi:DNA-binding transcriptional regulator YdaS (Cro superfamily)